MSFDQYGVRISTAVIQQIQGNMRKHFRDREMVGKKFNKKVANSNSYNGDNHCVGALKCL